MLNNKKIAQLFLGHMIVRYVFYDLFKFLLRTGQISFCKQKLAEG